MKSKKAKLLTIRDYHPLKFNFPIDFCFKFCLKLIQHHISYILLYKIQFDLFYSLGNFVFDFSSSGYLDVSVPPVRLLLLCIQSKIICLCRLGFPIRKFQDITLVTNSPGLIADYHVLHLLKHNKIIT